jgi:DivIVA domain-containing protein
MPLTPADVHNVVFKKPPIGKRGYDEDEVDAFLDVVEAELARLIEENNELRSAASRVGARMDERPEPPAPAPGGVGGGHPPVA